MNDLALTKHSDVFSVFDGFVKAKGHLFRISVEKMPTQTRIRCDWKLHYLLRKHVSFLEQRLQQCKSLDQFMDELKSILEHNLDSTRCTVAHPICYETILNHIQMLGWIHVHEINDDFTKVHLKIKDSAERQHILLVEFNSSYPVDAPKISYTLPQRFNLLWAQSSNLKNVYKQFSATVLQYQRFWDEVEELKCHTWILEPEYPNYAAVTFRLALGNGCSMQVKIDPLHPENLPECHFLGAEWAIFPFQDKFHNKFEDWNETLSILQNLRNLLEFDFPKRDSPGSQDVSLQCGICYAYRLGTDIPDQICNERKCGQAYHHQCLLEWIQSVPATKRSFDTLFGECPYCTSQMKVPLLHSR